MPFGRPVRTLFLVLLAAALPAVPRTGAFAAEGVHDAAPAADALTLEEAVRLAVARNERAGIADAQAAAAQARLERARAFFFPEVTVTGSYTRRSHETVRDLGGTPVVIQSRDALAATAVASLPLFDARAFPAWRYARLQRDAARLDATEQKRLLGFEAAEAFLRTLGVQDVEAAAVRRRDLARSAVDDARARFEAKIVGSNDVTRAELELATAERELARARGEAEVARLQLGHLLDSEIPARLDPPTALLTRAAEAPPEAAGLLSSARARRLDLGVARRQAGSLRALSREPLLRYLPIVGASATWRTTNEAGFTGREEDWWWGLNATWFLFDFERYADRRERKAQARAASLVADELERRIEVDVRQATVTLANAQAARSVAITAADIARKNAAETGTLYEQGLIGAHEAAEARVQLFEAEVALAREDYGLASAWLDLPNALGLEPLAADSLVPDTGDSP